MRRNVAGHPRCEGDVVAAVVAAEVIPPPRRRGRYCGPPFGKQGLITTPGLVQRPVQVHNRRVRAAPVRARQKPT